MMRSIQLFLTPLLVFAALTTPVWATPSQDAYNQGKKLLDQQNYKEALIYLNKAISLDPKDANAYYERALDYRMSGQNQKAIDDCTQVLKLDDRNSFAYHEVRGCAYGALAQYHKVIDDFTKVISLYPNHVDDYIYRAIAYEKLGQKDLAAKDKAGAIRLGYDGQEVNPQSHGRLGF